MKNKNSKINLIRILHYEKKDYPRRKQKTLVDFVFSNTHKVNMRKIKINAGMFDSISLYSDNHYFSNGQFKETITYHERKFSSQEDKEWNRLHLAKEAKRKYFSKETENGNISNY